MSDWPLQVPPIRRLEGGQDGIPAEEQEAAPRSLPAALPPVCGPGGCPALPH